MSPELHPVRGLLGERQAVKRHTELRVERNGGSRGVRDEDHRQKGGVTAKLVESS